MYWFIKYSLNLTGNWKALFLITCICKACSLIQQVFFKGLLYAKHSICPKVINTVRIAYRIKVCVRKSHSYSWDYLIPGICSSYKYIWKEWWLPMRFLTSHKIRLSPPSSDIGISWKWVYEHARRKVYICYLLSFTSSFSHLSLLFSLRWWGELCKNYTKLKRHEAAVAGLSFFSYTACF